jgi:tetratricopeptide (TPR) repeat protein
LADSARIDDLRRRVHKDPASIAFAQLAEELRRAGAIDESIATCRAGLAIHPGYLSARVTLGRALLEANALDEARGELQTVLRSAPENLAAIRGLAEIFHRQGQLPDALAQYRAALALAKNDPDLQQTVADLAKIVEPQKSAHGSEGLSFEQMEHELFAAEPPSTVHSFPSTLQGALNTVQSASAALSTDSPALSADSPALSMDSPALSAHSAALSADSEGLSADSAGLSTDSAELSTDSAGLSTDFAAPSTDSAALPIHSGTLTNDLSTLESAPSTLQSAPSTLESAPSTLENAPSTLESALSTVQSAPSTPWNRAVVQSNLPERQIAALQQWLDAIHVARTQPRP